MAATFALCIFHSIVVVAVAVVVVVVVVVAVVAAVVVVAVVVVASRLHRRTNQFLNKNNNCLSQTDRNLSKKWRNIFFGTKRKFLFRIEPKSTRLKICIRRGSRKLCSKILF